MEAKKSLGQHFLIAPGIARQIARSAELGAHEPVIEVGPGKGMLTRELLSCTDRIIAIEKDTTLIQKLTEKFTDAVATHSLTLIDADALSVDPASVGVTPGAYSVVANIPYNITGALIRHFIAGDTQPRTMVLLVQKEVAEQIAKSESESILSISVKAYGTPEYIGKVRSPCFRPRPRVDSAVLKITDISRDRFTESCVSEEFFFSVVRAGFAHKRKKLAGNLTEIAPKEVIAAAFSEAGIPPDARAQTVHVNQWFILARILAQSDQT